MDPDSFAELTLYDRHATPTPSSNPSQVSNTNTIPYDRQATPTPSNVFRPAVQNMDELIDALPIPPVEELGTPVFAWFGFCYSDDFLESYSLDHWDSDESESDSDSSQSDSDEPASDLDEPDLDEPGSEEDHINILTHTFRTLLLLQMEMRSINPDIGTLEPATGFVDAAAIQEFPSVLDGLCPGDGCGIFSLCSSSEAGYRQRPTVAQVERLEQIIGLRPRWWKAI